MLRRAFSNIRHAIINFFAAGAPAWLIEILGGICASLIYMRAVQSIPAYRRLVQQHLGYVPFILAAKSFSKLPVIDKNSYLRNNEFESVISGKISNAYAIQRSSGFSGTPSYWPKTTNEARKSNSSFRLVWDQYFNPKNEPALVIVGFSLGTWTSGTDILRLSNDLAIHGGRKVTTVSPGENVEESLELIRYFGKYFQRLIIFGNPVYIKSLVDQGRDIGWKSLNVVFVTGGEPTTEAWREYIGERLGIDINENLMHIINAYGASDFGATTATETPLSIRIKRLAMKDPKLAKALFGRDAHLPNFFQYHPLIHHIEQHGNNFLVTYWSQIPLIRYNVRDQGRVFRYKEVQKILAEHGYNIDHILGRDRQPYKLPFLAVDTRDDGTVSIGGANVYPGNIETAIIEHATLQANVEHFYICVTEDKNLNSRLVVELVIPGLESKTPEWISKFKETALQTVTTTLLRDNQEYRVTWAHNRMVTPVIQLLSLNEDDEHAIKRKYIKHDLELEGA